MNFSQTLMNASLLIGKRFLVILVLALSTILLFVTFNTSAQRPVELIEIPPPSQEEFTPADGLITLNPSSGPTITLDTIRLYDEDGSLWYEFSLDRDHPLYFKRHSESDFKPFAPLELFYIAIRLKAISRNWYEVIIDDRAQETKYARRGEFLLRRETFERYVLLSSVVTFDHRKNPLRETPDGHIRAGQIHANDEFSPVRIEGEWLLVEILKEPRKRTREFGWIQWKKDREILIGFMLNCKTCI